MCKLKIMCGHQIAVSNFVVATFVLFFMLLFYQE